MRHGGWPAIVLCMLTTSCSTDYPAFTGPSATVTSLSISGPSVLEALGSSGVYTAMAATAQQPAAPIYDNVTWTSSNSAVLEFAGVPVSSAVIGGGAMFIPRDPGSAIVRATYDTVSATMLVLVEAPSVSVVPPPTSPPTHSFAAANGIYDATVVGVFTTCGRGFHASPQGTLTVSGVQADGTGGQAAYTDRLYNTLLVSESGGRTLALAFSTVADGFRYSATLTQSTSDAALFVGTEDISGTDGCQAQYRWSATKR